MGTVSRFAGIFAYRVVVVAFWDNHVFDLAPSSSNSDGIVESVGFLVLCNFFWFEILQQWEHSFFILRFDDGPAQRWI
jgi:hypothetical protein